MSVRLVVVVLLGLLLLVGSAGVVEAVDAAGRAVTFVGEWLAPGWLYSYIDEQSPSGDDLSRYAKYWFGTLALVVLVAIVTRVLVLTVLIAFKIRYSVSLRIEARYRRGAALAARVQPDSHVPRSSVPRKWQRPLDAGVRERRRLRRALSLRQPMPTTRLRRYARADALADRSIPAANAAFARFGGMFAEFPGISTAFAPGAVILSAVLVLLGRPVPNQGAEVSEFADDVWHTLTSSEAGRLLPLTLLVLALFVVSRGTPLVDHIRARDEAAKDANRLLSELLGALGRLDRQLYEWRQDLDDGRFRIVRRWVDVTTSGRYCWNYDGGIERTDSVDMWGTSPIREHDGSELYAAMDAVTDVEQRLDRAGLSHVARRLTRKVRASTSALGLITGLKNWSIHREVITPTDLEERLENVRQRLPQISRASIEQPDDIALFRYHARVRRDDPDAGRKGMEAELEDRAFDCSCAVDTVLAETMLLELHAHRVAGYLHRRTHGSALMRALSVVQK